MAKAPKPTTTTRITHPKTTLRVFLDSGHSVDVLEVTGRRITQHFLALENENGHVVAQFVVANVQGFVEIDSVSTE